MTYVNGEVWHQCKQGYYDKEDPEFGAGEKQPNLPVELRLEEGRKSVDVAKYDYDVVEEEAYEAGY